MARLALQTAARAGTMTLLAGYRTASSLATGQIYRARVKQIKPPTFYIDRIDEGTETFTREESQRTVRVALRAIWGLAIDAGDAADQRDRFVDGFYAHVADNPDAFGTNATCSWLSVRDDPDWRPEWLENSESYYMTEITLEGFAAT